MAPGGRYRAANLALAALFLLLLAAPRALAVTPAGEGVLLPGGARLPELCLKKRLTGVPCSTCGVTRSIVAAAHGDLAGSVERHPGGLLLLAWVALQVPLRLALAAKPRGPRLPYWDLGITAASLLAVMAAVSLIGV